MQKKYHFILYIFLLPFFTQGQSIITPFENSDSEASATYFEAISYYKVLANTYNNISIQDIGPTDTDYPLSIVYYSGDKSFDINKWKADGKMILLINNGIHAGEPDGIDACMMLLRDAATAKIKIPSNIVLAVVPVFNIGGCLNRNSYSRANQNGPKEYGFRGNAQNLDLNRDFMKLDSKEARTLVQFMRKLDPNIFIDNHVSDGADYQHIMTLLVTQHNKLGGETGKYMNDSFVPLIYADMKKKGYDLVPYVNDFNATPDKGWREFYDPPRFGSGYAALWQTMAFVPETHMLKPYRQRVAATYQLMRSFIKMAAEHADEIKAARNNDRKKLQDKKEFALSWQVDTTKYTMIPFKGYEAGYKPSKVSGLPRLYYDRRKPYTKQVPFYNHFTGTQKVTAPKAYVIQQGWNDVIDRLKCNGVHMQKLERDTVMYVMAPYIGNFQTLPKPYEKHYLHSKIDYIGLLEPLQFIAGDYIISVNQPAKRYLIESLEPNAPDGFFAWNFFDAVLQQKEYFSDYVFEDTAARIIERVPGIKKMLEEKNKADTNFAKNGAAQLDFIYRHTQYCEPVNMRCPVFRIEY